MDENYLLSTVRYVELNPVKAKLCAVPQDWKWSSARAHIEGVDDSLVKVRPMLDRIDNWACYLSSDDHNGELISKHTSTGRLLGNEDFVNQLEKRCGLVLMPKKPGPKSIE